MEVRSPHAGKNDVRDKFHYRSDWTWTFFSGDEGEVAMELALRHTPVQFPAARIFTIFSKRYIFESRIRWMQ